MSGLLASLPGGKKDEKLTTPTGGDRGAAGTVGAVGALDAVGAAGAHVGRLVLLLVFVVAVKNSISKRLIWVSQ